MPLLKRQRVLAFKTEATPGTVETLTAAEATCNAYDIEIQANLEFQPRPGQGAFGHDKGKIGTRMGQVSFKTEMPAGVTNTAPIHFETLFPACGYVQSTDTFKPVTAGPGSGGVETITIAVYEGPSGASACVKKVLRGAMGTFKINLVSGKLAVIEWTFTGIMDPWTTSTQLAPTYDTLVGLRFASATDARIGTAIGCVQSFVIDSGNTVAMRECPTDVSGYESAIITDRLPNGTADPESRLPSSFDDYAAWLAGDEEEMDIAFTDGSDTITINAPACQRTNIQEGERNGMQIDQVSFQCNKSSDAGDDELSITWSA